MICQTCHGTTFMPCPECLGGYQHCCEGEVINEATAGWEATIKETRQAIRENDAIFFDDCATSLAVIRRELNRLEDAIFTYKRAK